MSFFRKPIKDMGKLTVHRHTKIDARTGTNDEDCRPSDHNLRAVLPSWPIGRAVERAL